MAKIEAGVSQDRKEATVFCDSARPAVLDSAQLEELIVHLIGTREGMLPPRAQLDPFGGTQVLVSEKMRWYCKAKHPAPGFAQLLLMHPGLGWVGIELGPEGIDALTAELQKARQSLPPKLEG